MRFYPKHIFEIRDKSSKHIYPLMGSKHEEEVFNFSLIFIIG